MVNSRLPAPPPRRWSTTGKRSSPGRETLQPARRQNASYGSRPGLAHRNACHGLLQDRHNQFFRKSETAKLGRAIEAAFVVEHPEKAKDVEAIYLAGVDGALQAYDAIHKRDMSYR